MQTGAVKEAAEKRQRGGAMHGVAVFGVMLGLITHSSVAKEHQGLSSIPGVHVKTGMVAALATQC